MCFYKKLSFSKISVFCVLLSLFSNCTVPVEPKFEFKEGLVFVEGFASTAIGASFVIINKSIIDFSVNTTIFVEGALVTFINEKTGEIVVLLEGEESYVPPANFKTQIGETWKLKITMPDGKKYESSPELVIEPVEILGVKATYNKELRYNEGKDEYESGHYVSITFDDPAEEENFYYWTFRSFEKLPICKTCFDAILRNGECSETDIPTPAYFDYPCETDCWRIRFPESINIFDDQFSNGETIADIRVADIPLYTNENMVVEIRQFSLTPAAYKYYKVLKDIVDNNGGFNAPPPAALIGNMINSNDDDDFVFGRFTAAATSTTNIFIKRKDLADDVIEFRRPVKIEPTLMSPYPPPATISTSCSESLFRTAIAPKEWK